MARVWPVSPQAITVTYLRRLRIEVSSTKSTRHRCRRRRAAMRPDQANTNALITDQLTP
jgi:hypothetical protein